MLLVEPDYNDLQTANDAADFRGLLDSPARAMVAVGFDLVLAAAYGLLGYVALRSLLAGRQAAWWAAAVVMLAAGGDEVENLFMVSTFSAEPRSQTDGSTQCRSSER